MLLLTLIPPRLWRVALFAVLLLLFLPALALATPSAPTLVLPGDQVWTLVIGSLVPLVTYVLNHVGPWVTEPIKALVLAVVAVVAGALYTALATHVFGLNSATLQLVLSAVVAAFATHHLIWKPAGVSILLGGGSNRPKVAPAANRPAAGPPNPGAPPA